MKEKINTQKGFIQIPLLIIVIVSIAVGGVGYGAIEYQKTSELVKKAEQLTKEEKYNEAIEKLEFAQNRWLTKNLGIKKPEISNKIERNKELLEDKSKYTQGIEEFNKGNWEKAKELLSKVSGVFPYYQDAKRKVEEAQNKIIEKQIATAVEKVTEEAQKKAEEAKKSAEEAQRKIEEEKTKRIAAEEKAKKKAEEAQKKAEEAKKSAEETQRKIEEEKTKRIAAEAQRKAEEEKTQKKTAELEQKIKELQQKQQFQEGGGYKALEIVEYLGEYIVNVACFGRYGETTIGSGIIYYVLSSGESVILTSYHILENADLTYEYPCVVYYSSDPTKGLTDFYWAEPIYYPSVASLSTMRLIDFGFLKIVAKFKFTEYEKVEIIPNASLLITNLVPVPCSEDEIEVGKEIVVLGYPTIGGEYLTATEGIISGFDGRYYFTTSAKVEEGNSGGGVFLKSTGCLAGMPTFVKLGRIEAFARLINIPYLEQNYLSRIWE